ncbi:hypothetical protein CANARDRAFT_27934 [[Candida] arabinofermentans NRRL YB-2248]|uniref:Uncharacterized protein n=1 Tax=[Candida] arabinofermentans NRRL YB-2248 TaxID=983967 RepID=A0A1E4T288_9ASCO|nr:hypothetical protein CANARDRAFT_27934 [[Candida] arabinofermentans NRRL YB-2248]
MSATKINATRNSSSLSNSTRAPVKETGGTDINRVVNLFNDLLTQLEKEEEMQDVKARAEPVILPSFRGLRYDADLDDQLANLMKYGEPPQGIIRFLKTCRNNYNSSTHIQPTVVLSDKTTRQLMKHIPDHTFPDILILLIHCGVTFAESNTANAVDKRFRSLLRFSKIHNDKYAILNCQLQGDEVQSRDGMIKSRYSIHMLKEMVVFYCSEGNKEKSYEYLETVTNRIMSKRARSKEELAFLGELSIRVDIEFGLNLDGKQFSHTDNIFEDVITFLTDCVSKYTAMSNSKKYPEGVIDTLHLKVLHLLHQKYGYDPSLILRYIVCFYPSYQDTLKKLSIYDILHLEPSDYTIDGAPLDYLTSTRLEYSAEKSTLIQFLYKIMLLNLQNYEESVSILASSINSLNKNTGKTFQLPIDEIIASLNVNFEFGKVSSKYVCETVQTLLESNVSILNPLEKVLLQAANSKSMDVVNDLDTHRPDRITEVHPFIIHLLLSSFSDVERKDVFTTLFRLNIKWLNSEILRSILDYSIVDQDQLFSKDYRTRHIWLKNFHKDYLLNFFELFVANNASQQHIEALSELLKTKMAENHHDYDVTFSTKFLRAMLYSDNLFSSSSKINCMKDLTDYLNRIIDLLKLSTISMADVQKIHICVCEKLQDPKLIYQYLCCVYPKFLFSSTLKNRFAKASYWNPSDIQDTDLSHLLISKTEIPEEESISVFHEKLSKSLAKADSKAVTQAVITAFGLNENKNIISSKMHKFLEAELKPYDHLRAEIYDYFKLNNVSYNNIQYQLYSAGEYKKAREIVSNSSNDVPISLDEFTLRRLMEITPEGSFADIFVLLVSKNFTLPVSQELENRFVQCLRHGSKEEIDTLIQCGNAQLNIPKELGPKLLATRYPKSLLQRIISHEMANNQKLSATYLFEVLDKFGNISSWSETEKAILQTLKIEFDIRFGEFFETMNSTPPETLSGLIQELEDNMISRYQLSNVEITPHYVNILHGKNLERLFNSNASLDLILAYIEEYYPFFAKLLWSTKIRQILSLDMAPKVYDLSEDNPSITFTGLIGDSPARLTLRLIYKTVMKLELSNEEVLELFKGFMDAYKLNENDSVNFSEKNLEHIIFEFFKKKKTETTLLFKMHKILVDARVHHTNIQFFQQKILNSLMCESVIKDALGAYESFNSLYNQENYNLVPATYAFLVKHLLIKKETEKAEEVFNRMISDFPQSKMKYNFEDMKKAVEIQSV